MPSCSRRFSTGAFAARRHGWWRRSFCTGRVAWHASAETRRWIIPKGWPKKGKSPHRSAAREAFEEAGVIGAVGKRAIGSFSYEKRLKDGGSIECEVRVFPLEVKRQQKEWPEKHERRIKWLSPSKAAAQVKDPVLSKLIRRVARKYA